MFSRLSACLLIISLLLVACSTPPPPQITAEQKVAAAEFALQADIRLRTLVEDCRLFSPATNETAKQALSDWHQHNWPSVFVANAEYQTHVKHQQSQHGPIYGVLQAVKFNYDQQQSHQIIQGLPQNPLVRERRCRREFQSYLTGQYHLGSSEHAAVLAMLKQQYGQPSSQAYPVPPVDGDLRAQKLVGKSFYRVEKISLELACPEREVFNLRDNWPDELYGVYCSDGRQYVYKCHWGECTQPKPAGN